MAFQELFLGRQPILDRDQNLVAFELLFRSSQVNGAHIEDDLLASATVINHAFSDLGVRRCWAATRASSTSPPP